LKSPREVLPEHLESVYGDKVKVADAVLGTNVPLYFGDEGFFIVLV